MFWLLKKAIFRVKKNIFYNFINIGRNILKMNANETHYFSNLFDKSLFIFLTCPLSIIRSISTMYTRNSR